MSKRSGATLAFAHFADLQRRSQSTLSFLCLSFALFLHCSFLPCSQNMVNPNNAVLPDYATPAFAEDRQPFLDASLLEQQAVELLSQQWIIKNNRDKEAWARREEEEIIAAAKEEERADQNADSRRRRKRRSSRKSEKRTKQNSRLSQRFQFRPNPSSYPRRSPSGKSNITSSASSGISPTRVWTSPTLPFSTQLTMTHFPSSHPLMERPLWYPHLQCATGRTSHKTKTCLWNSSGNPQYAWSLSCTTTAGTTPMYKCTYNSGRHLRTINGATRATKTSNMPSSSTEANSGVAGTTVSHPQELLTSHSSMTTSSKTCLTPSYFKPVPTKPK
jgi:hypothetical protein